MKKILQRQVLSAVGGHLMSFVSFMLIGLRKKYLPFSSVSTKARPSIQLNLGNKLKFKLCNPGCTIQLVGRGEWDIMS